MKVHITFAIETGATGRDLAEIQEEAVKVGTRFWLRSREHMGDRATLVAVVPEPTEDPC